MSLSHDVRASLRAVLNNISQSVKKHKVSHEVRLLAVSKTKPNSYVQAAYDEGQRHFGENYVNELLEKAPLCPADVKWHFIGHLQSNKCGKLVKIPNLYQVESIDDAKLATKLNHACEQVGRTTSDPLRVLIQVNTSGEASKSGCKVDECGALARHILDNCPFLKIQGLMTIGQYEPVPVPTDFITLRKCKEQFLKEFPQFDVPDFQMSMGMTHDFDVAIEMGSTQVRVGQGIFGPRTYITTNDDDHENSN